MQIHWMQSRLRRLEDIRDEADRAAAFINREIDGDVSSSAAGSRGKEEGGKKKKKGEREGERREETWPAARRSVSMTSNMLIQSLHSYMCRKNRESGGKVRERGHGRGRKMQCPDDLAFKNERILFFPPLLKRLLGFHTVMPIICAHREPGTPCAWFIQQWRANGESWGGREEGETGHHEVIQSSRITNTPGQQLIMSFNHGEHPCQATKQRVFNTKRKKKQQQKNLRLIESPVERRDTLTWSLHTFPSSFPLV